MPKAKPEIFFHVWRESDTSIKTVGTYGHSPQGEQCECLHSFIRDINVSINRNGDPTAWARERKPLAKEPLYRPFDCAEATIAMATHQMLLMIRLLFRNLRARNVYSDVLSIVLDMSPEPPRHHMRPDQGGLG